MPIKINLLAEAQELEEQKRRDPVKRFVLGGALLIIVILVWSSTLFAKTLIAKGELTRLEGQAKASENSYKQILENQKNLIEKKRRIAALDRLAANRFLNGSALNALQKDHVENVSLIRFKVDQTYALIPEVKPVSGSRTMPKPATIKETIALSLTAKDKSPVSGDAVSKFQKRLSEDSYLNGMLDASGFRLVNLSPAQTDTDGRSYVLLNVEGHLPEKIR